jgi:photosystem II stability/assembly factor-like uncharacterized protein
MLDRARPGGWKLAAESRPTIAARALKLLRMCRPVVLVALVTISAGAMSAGRATLDPLERTAVDSTRLTRSVILAVTDAGGRLVAVGERGQILLSDDNGAAWRQAKVPVSVTLTAVRFATPSQGWAVGHFGVVLHTEDGGESWVMQLDGTRAGQLAYEYFDARKPGANGNMALAKEQLAAAAQLRDDGPDKPFLDLYFENATTGFIVGAYDLIFRTQDGGKTWQPWQDRIANPRGLHLNGIVGAGSDIFVAGEQGSFFRSTDRGESFAALPTPYTGSYFGLVRVGNGDLIIFGLRGNAFRSSDQGATWLRVETNTTASITAGVLLRDGSVALVTQAAQILLSEDQGRSFRALAVEGSGPLAGISQMPDGRLSVVGTRGIRSVSLPVGTRNPSLDSTK